MNNYNDLWVQKHAPKTIKDVILTLENREFFSNISENTPHLLLYGNAGTGKTTLAKILVKDVLKCQYLYINASDENGVDTIRNKVISFSQTRSFDGKKKVIILDEFCGTTPEAQRILRNVMEEYASTTRFILTANYINKIIEPICSRCLLFNIVPNLNDTIKRCHDILEQENIKVSDVERENLKKYIESCFPDVRRIVNDLQRFSLSGTLNVKTSDNLKKISDEVYNLICSKKDVNLIRKTVIEQENNFNSEYQKLLKELFDLFYNSNQSDNIKKQILIQIGEHMYRDNFVVDHEINFFCCIILISELISN